MRCTGGLVLAALIYLCSATADAATVTVHATAGGQPLADAVVTAVARDPGAVPHTAHARNKSIMVQQFQQFDPFVLPVQVGTKVEFPNRDPFRHHVYANSPAKSFELKLYGGDRAESVTFDKEGVVALGCNIHDNMLAYIYVVATPFFAKTDAAGTATLTDLPAGSYRIALWHPNQKAGAAPTDDITLAADEQHDLTLATEVKHRRGQLPPRPADENAY
jgi:plastocyanin